VETVVWRGRGQAFEKETIRINFTKILYEKYFAKGTLQKVPFCVILIIAFGADCFLI